ncbi:MAG: cytochrome c family protein [Pseudomonadota bacterium]
MDTLEFNKIAAALFGSFLALQLFGWAAEMLYHPEGVGINDGFEVASSDAPAEPVEAAPVVPFSEVLLTASADAGERVWRQCSSCHALEQGANRVGPYLWGVVGRDIGAIDGFRYSDAMAGFGNAWTPENLNQFLIAPSEYMPGTAMAYRGLRDVEDRANLIAYMAASNGVDILSFE